MNQIPNTYQELPANRAKTTDKMGRRKKLTYEANKDLDEVVDPLMNYS